jgi:hypothetical protein
MIIIMIGEEAYRTSLTDFHQCSEHRIRFRGLLACFVQGMKICSLYIFRKSQCNDCFPHHTKDEGSYHDLHNYTICNVRISYIHFPLVVAVFTLRVPSLLEKILQPQI